MRRRRERGDVVTTTLRSQSVAILFWALSIEVTRDDDERLRARVCRVQTTDAAGSCNTRPDAGPDCATSGTLELGAFPGDDTTSATGLHLRATFASGATIDARL
ncbi:MAG: hypothetical protein M3Y87_35025 [Myxococcota bacterium]|nr:hypothetical protein [Myxococcota bacterium]